MTAAGQDGERLVRLIAQALSREATGRGYRLRDERFHLARAAYAAVAPDIAAAERERTRRECATWLVPYAARDVLKFVTDTAVHSPEWLAGYKQALDDLCAALVSQYGSGRAPADDEPTYAQEMAELPDAARPDLELAPGTQAEGYSIAPGGGCDDQRWHR